ncbi:E3 ubiquitin-protein ligase XIAP [Bombina bombina]|uniref:E3 ubiquitin-protein ligase XIAP n=1 Tax=Bombina bombina TaxID=8345 RepID=UPI00235B0120|nr:E3 ubiquitin-protein ligase XIAP [Bombina bombina]XP_053555093.1 E3 ubiquitin-protein ligase XIAP [Bombina bombina]XP_053555094.1 E3 ubiquitin-protein ligase XIAP [Bombina bombina]
MTCKCPRMSDVACDMDIDKDFSEESSRIASFTNFPSSCPVSASTLARAGFYYTGSGDRVKCFSCQGIVEGWQHGDTAIGKHRKISPNCPFVNGFNFRSDCIQTQIPILQNSNPHLVENCVPNAAHAFNHESSSELNADFLLRTGRVVDMSEPNYPRYIKMCSEEARLRTFKNWPCYARLTPKEMANAGLFYTGFEDQVTCFCCGGKLMNWEPNDQAWIEHRKHFPDCLFVLGHDIGNVALETMHLSSHKRRVSEAPDNPDMIQYKARLDSFAQWAYPISKESLAKSGLYSIGDGDRTQCFCCGGALQGWKLKDDAWEEHAKWYPGCKFLLEEKGQHFINNIQLHRSPQNCIVGSSESHNALPEDSDLSKNPLVVGAEQMGFDFEAVKNIMEKRIKATGKNYTSLEVLVSDLLNAQTENGEEKPREKEISVEEKLRQLQEEKICKVCMDRTISIVFIPCGHLVVCAECAEEINKCPICCTVIQRRQKIFLS